MYQLSGSTLLLGAAAFAQQIPFLLLAPVAGVFVDRFDRRRLLVATNSIAALQASTMFALVALGVVQPWHLIAGNLVLGLVNAWDAPARQSILIQLVGGRADLPSAIAQFGNSVVKPRVGAGGRGVTVFDMVDGGPPDLDESRLGPGPWVVQPLLESVRTEGEYSVFVLDGRVVSQAQKRPAAGEIRVHEMYGGRTEPVDLTEEAADVARRTVSAAEALLGTRLDYARVDQMRLADGTLAVSELEVTEPGLYLDVLPGNAELFASLLARRVEGEPSRRNT